MEEALLRHWIEALSEDFEALPRRERRREGAGERPRRPERPRRSERARSEVA